MKHLKIEIYPDGFDEHGRAQGRRVLSMSITKHNIKRFESMTEVEKRETVSHIERFEQVVGILKQELIK